MEAGRLDRRITIQQPTSDTSGYGEPRVTWTDLARVPAELVEPGSREFFQGGTQAENTAAFRIRHRDDVRHGHRIVYEGTNYDIVGIKELGRRQGLEITAKALVS